MDYNTDYFIISKYVCDIPVIKYLYISYRHHPVKQNFFTVKTVFSSDHYYFRSNFRKIDSSRNCAVSSTCDYNSFIFVHCSVTHSTIMNSFSPEQFFFFNIQPYFRRTCCNNDTFCFINHIFRGYSFFCSGKIHTYYLIKLTYFRTAFLSLLTHPVSKLCSFY